ncbi:Vesicle-associated protein 2-1 [Linum grandiflorum]
MSTTTGGGGGSNQLITVHPDELRFIFEVDKQSFCDLKVVNNTERHVAFKVKTTSPKKYFVRPNTGVIQPWDSCVIRVTLQAQRESPPDMQCKDKFLLLSTTVPQHTDVDELPPDTFTKDSNGRTVEECKLRVLYIPPSAQGNGEDDALTSPGQSFDGNFNMQRLKDERDAAVRQTQQLQQELVRFNKASQLPKNESRILCQVCIDCGTHWHCARLLVEMVDVFAGSRRSNRDFNPDAGTISSTIFLDLLFSLYNFF